jgi:DNA-binding transcriptional LysR family regulator
MMQTVLSLVASEAGAAIVPACVSNLRADGVKFLRLVPDDARVELIATWLKGAPSVVLQSFFDLLQNEADTILSKVKGHIP